MDIGPVNVIRPVSTVRPSPPDFANSPDSDLTGVFATEFSKQRDDSYSPNHKSTRGLEDEDEQVDEEIAEPGSSPESNSIRYHTASSPSISFFA
jgi:hypothetical protein